MDPITGGLGSILGTVGNLMLGAIDIPVEVAKAVAFKSADSGEVNKADLSATSIEPAESTNRSQYDDQRHSRQSPGNSSYHQLSTESPTTTRSNQPAMSDFTNNAGLPAPTESQDSNSRHPSRSHDMTDTEGSLSVERVSEAKEDKVGGSKTKGKITAGKVRHCRWEQLVCIC